MEPGRRRSVSCRGATLSLIDIDALKHHVNEAERARGEAERANLAKDEFLATLSHEIPDAALIDVDACPAARAGGP